MTLSEAYHSLYEDFLKDAAAKLAEHLKTTFAHVERVDAISARAKTPERFLAKAEKTDEDGYQKYEDPLNQIQDQIGARLTVFYLRDVPYLTEQILRYFTPIEILHKEPERDFEFGYFGEHFILKLPDDVIPEGADDIVPEFFELQLKTLFQHAWSEAHHDLGYKSPRELSALEKRKIAFTAAQAWGADRIFDELAWTVFEDTVVALESPPAS